jgi:signal transduction histidine kinase/ActR/RegA family two-component response regulator
MRLRSHLLLLTLVTLLPMVVFGISATILIANREREVFREGAQDRTRALLTALDSELTGYVTSLRALASSRQLEIGNLRGFYDEAVRVLASQEHWRSISLARPSGERIFQTDVAFETRLPEVLERRSFDQAVRTGQPTIGNLARLDGANRIPVRLPVERNEKITFVLSVTVDPDAVLALLSPQRLPADWVGVVLDSNRRIVARTVDHGRTVGQPASDSLRAALDRGSEGWFEGTTIEGTEVYTPFSRSSVSGWTVAIGIPRDEVDSAASRAVQLLTLGTLAAVAAAVVLAVAIGRRISAPIMSLASTAAELGGGTPVTSSGPRGVSEVNEVRLALARASDAIRERQEALRAADRAKDEFLAMLGHELRNPLAALASAAALLNLNPQNDRRTGAAVAAIGRQVRHMTRLVDDLLDVSRATTGKIKLARQPRNLADTVTATLRAMKSSGRLDDHEVNVDISPVWVDADETRTEQIVSNLVENAVKYTAPGGRIAVRVFRRADDAVLQVEDTGIGLAPELLPRVFDLFVQGERSLDRRSGGLGIGLTLVKRLTELHGGRVSAASDGPGRGARFTVMLPAIEALTTPTTGTTAPHAAREGCRVLLIEDNDDAREMMRVALEYYGYDVFDAADGPSGIQAAAGADPHVVIIDLGLPGLDGYAVARELRAQPERRTTVLIALTGYGQAEARERALQAGFDEHVTKPVMPDKLAQLIASMRPAVDSARRAGGAEDSTASTY